MGDVELVHNPLNGVTGGVWRRDGVHAFSGSRVVDRGAPGLAQALRV